MDSIGGARLDSGGGGDSEVQRTMLELLNQLDGFESSKQIKVRAFTKLVIYSKNRDKKRASAQVFCVRFMRVRFKCQCAKQLSLGGFPLK